MAVPKLERLMNLVAALLQTSVPLSAASIGTRVEGYSSEELAFRRQFSRDKADLREMGVVIRVEPVPESNPPVDGYRIDPADYYLEDPGLEPDELAVLHLATRLIDVGGPGEARNGLFKLGGSDPSVADVPTMAALPTNPHLVVLFDAVAEHRWVRFDYHGRTREVVAGALGFQGGHWYLSGWERSASDQRVYRLDRIEGTTEVGEPAGPETAVEDRIGPLHPWNVGNADRFTARLRVAPTVLGEVLARVGPEVVVEQCDDGGAECTFEVTNREGFRTWVLGLGADVEVYEPDELRTEIIEWLQRFVEENR